MKVTFSRGSPLLVMLLAAALSAPATGAQPVKNDGTQNRRQQAAGFQLNSVVGGGYDSFTASNGPGDGDESFWVSAQGLGRYAIGRWYADVYIKRADGSIFDFEALYTVNCVEVNRVTKESWIIGTVIESNNPAVIGVRALLYIKDGGGAGTHSDLHSITPLIDRPDVNCQQRPMPDFRAPVRSGDYIVR